MKKIIIGFSIAALCLISGLFAQYEDNFFTIQQLYENADTLAGDTVYVVAFYSTPADSLLLDIYWEVFKDEPYPPQSIAKLIGTPPTEMFFGGLMAVRGIVSFVDIDDGFWSQDTLIAYIKGLEYFPLFDGDSTIMSIRSGEHGETEPEHYEYHSEIAGCDSCKFALLISGGIRPAKNYQRYWLDLEETYTTKVDSEGYCPENIFINYFKGQARGTGVIDTTKAHLTSASLPKIRANIDSIAKKIAACKRAGKKTEFQKQISNHGTDGPPPGICLLGDTIITKDSLFKWEQTIIDSGCDRMIDIITTCYGGYMVDTLRHLNPKDSCKIDIGSVVNRRSGWGFRTRPHTFRKAYLDSIKKGHPPNKAAVEAKLEYDNFMRNSVLPQLHNEIEKLFNAWLDAPVGSALEADLWRRYQKAIADSADADSSICETPIVRIIPMHTYCQYETVWVPPGGQLVLDFKGDPSNCGNVTVWQDSAGHLIRETQWNFNLTGGGVRRVINGKDGEITMFIIHNDDNSYSITTTSSGRQTYDETPENRIDYAGASFAGINDSPEEFDFITMETYFVEDADIIGFDLKLLPAMLGLEGVQDLIVGFNPPGWNEWWNDMEIFIVVLNVSIPGNLQINCPPAEFSSVNLVIDEPGIYTAHLGSIHFESKAPFNIEFLSSDGSFLLDAWALRPTIAVGIDENHNWVNSKPYGFSLHQNYPEPFNSTTNITFDIPFDTHAKLEILDVLGKIVSKPLDSDVKEGHHSITVDMSEMSSGIYFYRLTTPEFTRTRRMTLVK